MYLLTMFVLLEVVATQCPVDAIKRDAIEIWDDMKSLFPKLAEIAMITDCCYFSPKQTPILKQQNPKKGMPT